MRFYVVGSALHKKRPRDVDLYGVMEDVHFESAFELNPKKFAALHHSEKDTANGDMLKWKNECLGATRVLQIAFPELVPIDFKFIPKSLLKRPYREVDLTMPVMTWRIGFPGFYKGPSRLPESSISGGSVS